MFIASYPPMVHNFAHHFFEVAQRQAIAQVPGLGQGVKPAPPVINMFGFVVAF
jgi:hypothetical protein